MSAGEALATGIVDAVSDDAVADALHRAASLTREPPAVVAEILRQTKIDDAQSIHENLLGFARCLRLDHVAKNIERIDAEGKTVETL